jgi:hypothetical protein
VVLTENTAATLDADFLGDDEHVINMEDFGDVLQNVDCTAPHLALDFKDNKSFQAAIQKWTWVNQRESRHFFMIVNHPACGRKVSRRPFKITNIRYDNKKYVAFLDGREVDYKSCLHDGHLRIETTTQQPKEQGNPTEPAEPTEPTEPTEPQGVEGVGGDNSTEGIGFNSTSLARRASVNKSVSLKKDFTGNIFKTGSGNTSASLDCTDCGTNGELKVTLDVSVKLFSIKKAYVEFRATNVEAKLNIALSGSIQKKYSDTKELFTVNAVGVEIPEIAKLSFGPAFGVGWGATLTGNGKLTFGAGAALTPNSVARVCLKGCDTGTEG